MLSGELAVLQAPMFDGLSLGALGLKLAIVEVGALRPSRPRPQRHVVTARRVAGRSIG
jgi:hypothetical protein